MKRRVFSLLRTMIGAALAFGLTAGPLACGTPSPPADAKRPPGPVGDASPAELVDGAAGASADAGPPEGLGPALVGVYAAARDDEPGRPAPRPPLVERLVLRADGTFVADVDTGVRCVTTPCPSHLTVTGHFVVVAEQGALDLRPHDGDAQADLHGRHLVTLDGPRLVLRRGDGGDGGGSGGEVRLARVAPVFDETATALVASSRGGGFAPPAPSGSSCAVGQVRYRYDRATRALASEQCEAAGPGKPYALRRKARTLGPEDAARVEARARAVAPSTQSLCGVDKPLLELEVTSPSGPRAFADAFYACRGEGRIYVEGLDPLFTVLRELAR